MSSALLRCMVAIALPWTAACSGLAPLGTNPGQNVHFAFPMGPTAAQAQLGKATIDTLRGGIVRLSSNGPTEWSPNNGWRLVLEQTIEETENTPDAAGRIENMALVADGRVVVSERKPTRIRLYTPGNPKPTILAREGEGPGEVKWPVVKMRGDTLFISDGSLHRVTAMSLAGKVLFSVPMIGINATATPVAIDPNGLLRIETPRRAAGNNNLTSWIRIDRTGAIRDTLIPVSELTLPMWTRHFDTGGRVGAVVSTSYSVPLVAESGYDILGDGTLLYGRTDRNEFLVTRNGRDTVRIFRRTDTPSVRVTASSRDSIFKYYDKLMPGVPKKEDIPANWPFWERLQHDDAGNIWVRQQQGSGKPGVHYDVYAPNGAYRGEVSVDFTSFRPSFAGDRVAVADVNADGLPRVRVYRIVKGR